MTSTAVSYKCEEREPCKGLNLSMVDIYVNPSKYIPFNRDCPGRKCTMTSSFQAEIDRTLNFKGRPDDVWVVTLPKCGTTWMQEAAWLIYNDFDFETASTVPLSQRSPYVEFSGLMSNTTGPNGNTFDEADNLKSPRLLKSHLPASLLPIDIWKNKRKIIYVARNVKDAVVSFYPFAKTLGVFSGSIEEFVEAFMKDGLFYSPYWPHVLDFYDMRDEHNIYFTSYERMKMDLKGVIKELCTFMEKKIPSEDILEKAVEHLSIDSMRKSKAGEALQQKFDSYDKENNNNGFKFLRRGIVGSYKDELPPELVTKLDLWSEEYLKEANTSNKEVFGF